MMPKTKIYVCNIFWLECIKTRETSYKYAEDLIWWAILGIKYEDAEGEAKLRQKKADKRKKKKL